MTCTGQEGQNIDRVHNRLPLASQPLPVSKSELPTIDVWYLTKGGGGPQRRGRSCGGDHRAAVQQGFFQVVSPSRHVIPSAI
jgi:hypothetical protein